ncbi:MAG TPA: recombinase, partial [Nitrospira sp.]|nr:recombinase [Nitrospira sp.]
MRTPTHEHKNTNVAIGYVRVSTQEQAQDGVSLDVQRDKIRAYCKNQGIRLIDIKSDQGISGGTMERPALQAALAALDRGQANTLIVVKLDRLSRSVKDLCQLIDKYFAHEQYHLLSLCGMVNTHSAAGRMMMLNLANYAQFERELIRERT